MSSLYKPLNEEEVMRARFNLLDEGDYEAVVRTSIQRPSETGNIMADMTLHIYDKEGQIHEVRDFLVFSKKMLWKVKHFCDSAKLSDIYLSGQFTPENAVNKKVKVRIKIQLGNEIPPNKLNGKPLGAKYPDKNIVDDYLFDDSQITMKPLPDKKDEFINDDIPF